MREVERDEDAARRFVRCAGERLGGKAVKIALVGAGERQKQQHRRRKAAAGRVGIAQKIGEKRHDLRFGKTRQRVRLLPQGLIGRVDGAELREAPHALAQKPFLAGLAPGFIGAQPQVAECFQNKIQFG